MTDPTGFGNLESLGFAENKCMENVMNVQGIDQYMTARKIPTTAAGVFMAEKDRGRQVITGGQFSRYAWSNAERIDLCVSRRLCQATLMKVIEDIMSEFPRELLADGATRPLDWNNPDFKGDLGVILVIVPHMEGVSAIGYIYNLFILFISVSS